MRHCARSKPAGSVSRFLAVPIVIAGLVMPTMTRAEPASELQGLLEMCDQNPDKACEQMVWDFVDVSGDLRLGKAELARFFRLVAELNAPVDIEQKNVTEIVTFLGGPLAAQSILDNYDYDGDGFLTRSELLHEAGPSDIKAFAARILQTGKDAFLMGSSLAANPLGGARINKRQAARPQVIRPQATRPVTPSPVRPQKQSHAVIIPETSLPLKKSEIDAVREKIKSCLTSPLFSKDGERFDFHLKFALNLDGSIRGMPVVLGQKGDKYYRIAAQAVQQAIVDCGPYDMLPKAKYPRWKEFELTLSRRTMLGG